MNARMVVIFFSLSLLNACATYVPIDMTNSEALYDVSVNDKVRVLTKDQKSYEFKVVKVTNDSLQGEEVEIPFTNIDELLVEKSNGLVDIKPHDWFFVGAAVFAVVIMAGMLMFAGDFNIGGG